MTTSNFSHHPLDGEETAEGYRVKRDKDGVLVQHVPFGEFNKVSLGTAGGLFSTLEDMLTWLKLQVNDGEANGSKLVSAENLREMHSPQIVIPVDVESEKAFGSRMAAYGMGWFIEPHKGYTLISHGGEVDGHTVWVGFIPEEKVSAVALTNVTQNPAAFVLARAGLDRALNLPDNNWNAKLHKLVDSAQGEQLDKTKEVNASAAPMSHALESYVGTYQAKGYPDFIVKLEGAILQACTVNSLIWGALEHYHHDTFEWHIPEMNFRMKVRFVLDAEGDVGSAYLPLEPAVGDIVFKRSEG